MNMQVLDSTGYKQITPGSAGTRASRGRPRRVRSVRKPRVRKRGISEPEFLGNSLWTWEFDPFELKYLLESNPLKSRFTRRALREAPLSWPLVFVSHLASGPCP